MLGLPFRFWFTASWTPRSMATYLHGHACERKQAASSGAERGRGQKVAVPSSWRNNADEIDQGADQTTLIRVLRMMNRVRALQ